MENFSTPLLERTKEYVGGFIGENFSEKICYHNIDHTLDVVEAAEKIGKYCKISNEDLEIVIIAAWFHDTGYYLGCKNHEKSSASIAKDYLMSEHFDSLKIEKVINCILSTKMPQKPSNSLEEIICDADLFHLATEGFFDKSELLLHEITLLNKDMIIENWLVENKEFVESHDYHTPYGKNILLPGKAKNLEIIKTKIKSN